MLRFFCFGHFHVDYQNAPFVLNVRPNTRRLLLYLLLNHRLPLQRRTLAFTLWPDTTETNALAILRRSLYNLSNALPDDHEWILKSSSTLQWNANTAFWLDVVEFERLCRIDAYFDKALDLYTDDLLTEHSDEWIQPERERLRTLYLHTLKKTIDHYRRQGRISIAIDTAVRGLADNPWQETIVQDLMRLYYQDGNQAAAIQTFDDYQKQLSEELGLEPMDETISIFNAIVDKTLKFNAAIQDSIPDAPFTVPAPVTGFVGRDDDLLRLSDLLAETHTARHVTLLGPPGIGKTRLATEFAWRMRPHYPDGIFFVDLSDVNHAAQAGLAIASQILSAVMPDAEPSVEAVKEYIRQRYILLIIDNFEQVLDARDLIDEILKVSTGLHLVVTSRVPLKLYGEYEYSLDLLKYPVSEIALGEAAAFSALTLFVERSRHRNPTFTLTDENLPMVTNICRRLDGLPLAIELVAAKTGDMDLAAIEQALVNRFALLVSDLYNIDPRHQTLRTAIAWSVNLLPPATQRAFARLGVFAAGWTPETIKAMLNSEIDVAALMEELSEHHLIKSQETELGRRFDMLVSIRDYALEMLMQSGDADHVMLNFIVYFADMASEARENWHGNELSYWFARLRIEEENLRRALQWALTDNDQFTDDRVIHGVRLATDVNRYWQAQGNDKEGLQWLEQALPLATDVNDTLRVRLLLTLAISVQNLHRDFARAARLQDEALHISYRTEDDITIARALVEIGTAHARQGKYEDAAPFLEDAADALRGLRKDTDVILLTAALNNLALVRRYLGDYAACETLLSEVIDLRRQLQDSVETASALSNLGNLAILRGDFQQARELYTEALLLVRDLNAMNLLLTFLYGFAHISYELGWAVHCVRLSGAAIALAASRGKLRSPEKAKRFTEKLDKLRDQMGNDAYEKLFEEGRQMDAEAVVQYMLETFSQDGS